MTAQVLEGIADRPPELIVSIQANLATLIPQSSSLTPHPTPIFPACVETGRTQKAWMLWRPLAPRSSGIQGAGFSSSCRCHLVGLGCHSHPLQLPTGGRHLTTWTQCWGWCSCLVGSPLGYPDPAGKMLPQEMRDCSVVKMLALPCEDHSVDPLKNPPVIPVPDKDNGGP